MYDNIFLFGFIFCFRYLKYCWFRILINFDLKFWLLYYVLSVIERLGFKLYNMYIFFLEVY